MATENKQQTIQSPLHQTINSRLLFNTKEDGEKFLNIKLKNIKSENNIRPLVDRLNEKAEKDAMIDLGTLLDLYNGALDRYKQDKGLKMVIKDASERRIRKEIRKILAVRLFIWTYVGHTREGKDKALQLNSRIRYSEETFKLYCPEPGGEELIDVCFTVLFNWDIIQPNGPNTTDYIDRDIFNEKKVGRDFSVSERNNRMLKLLGAIKDEMPRIGIFGSGELPAINLAIKEILYDEENNIYPSSAQYWLMLQQIGMAALASASKDTLSSTGLETYSLRMPGIWKDNDNNGSTRFWIFPSNYQYAFCYERSFDNTDKWVLSPFEIFVCTSDITSEDYQDDYIVWIGNEDSETIIRNGGKEARISHISYLKFELEYDENDQLIRVVFKPIKPSLSNPFQWTKFERLEHTNYLFSSATDVLKCELSRYSDKITINGIELILRVNAIIGLDTQYLYLYDYPKMDTCHFKIISNDCENGVETYECIPSFPYKLNFFDIEKKEGKKIIAIPRQDVLVYDKSDPDYDYIQRLQYAMTHTMIDGFVTIYNFDDSGNSDEQKIIFFNNFSVGVSVRKLKQLLKLRKNDKLDRKLSDDPPY